LNLPNAYTAAVKEYMQNPRMYRTNHSPEKILEPLVAEKKQEKSYREAIIEPARASFEIPFSGESVN
jgi:hypothetical protein